MSYSIHRDVRKKHRHVRTTMVTQKKRQGAPCLRKNVYLRERTHELVTSAMASKRVLMWYPISTPLRW